jgi:hypothetical protein
VLCYCFKDVKLICLSSSIFTCPAQKAGGWSIFDTVCPCVNAFVPPFCIWGPWRPTTGAWHTAHINKLVRWGWYRGGRRPLVYLTRSKVGFTKQEVVKCKKFIKLIRVRNPMKITHENNTTKNSKRIFYDNGEP